MPKKPVSILKKERNLGVKKGHEENQKHGGTAHRSKTLSRGGIESSPGSETAGRIKSKQQRKPRQERKVSGTLLQTVQQKGGDKQLEKAWGCHSIVDRQAAAAVQRLLAAKKTASSGISIKAVTLAPHIKSKRATFKVTCETLSHLPAIQALLKQTGLLERHKRLQESIAYVLCYETVFGEGLKPHGPAERAVLACKTQLLDAAEALRATEGVGSIAELRKDCSSDNPHPRTARVNTLKLSVKGALSRLRDSKDTAWQPPFREVRQDDLLSDVLVFPHATDLHNHPLVKTGALVLQSKVSCMPAHALAPKEGWAVVDACAAPGNKTTHLAALMRGRGRIVAFDRDPKRLKRLQMNAETRGCDCIEARCQDFLETDPCDAELCGVRAILLDPSCSGSGTAVWTENPQGRGCKKVWSVVWTRTEQALSRMDDLLPTREVEPYAEEQRLAALSAFQRAALLHALSFPAAERLVYSTCSVHVEENEEVVRAVLPEARDQGWELGEALPGWRRRGLPLFEGCENLVRTDPDEDGMDGFFVALFCRKPLQ